MKAFFALSCVVLLHSAIAQTTTKKPATTAAPKLDFYYFRTVWNGALHYATILKPQKATAPLFLNLPTLPCDGETKFPLTQDLQGVPSCSSTTDLLFDPATLAEFPNSVNIFTQSAITRLPVLNPKTPVTESSLDWSPIVLQKFVSDPSSGFQAEYVAGNKYTVQAIIADANGFAPNRTAAPETQTAYGNTGLFVLDPPSTMPTTNDPLQFQPYAQLLEGPSLNVDNAELQLWFMRGEEAPLQMFLRMRVQKQNNYAPTGPFGPWRRFLINDQFSSGGKTKFWGMVMPDTIYFWISDGVNYVVLPANIDEFNRKVLIKRDAIAGAGESEPAFDWKEALKNRKMKQFGFQRTLANAQGELVGDGVNLPITVTSVEQLDATTANANKPVEVNYMY